MGKVRIGASIASIAAAAVAGIFIDLLPATIVFAAAAIISMPGAIAFFWIRDEGRVATQGRRNTFAVAREIWHDRRYRQLLSANTVFGLGNLMNVAIVPIMLVDHFDAPNSFVGGLAALTSVTAAAAYLFWGRLIDRGSSLQLSAYASTLLLLVPLTYMFAPSIWFLVPLAIVMGIVTACFEITYHTNVVQVAPPGRVLDYATAQSFLLGIRGTIAPFTASLLMALIQPRMVLGVAITFMVVGLALYYRAVREYAADRLTELAPEPVAEPSAI
jgi:MFS family permease